VSGIQEGGGFSRGIRTISTAHERNTGERVRVVVPVTDGVVVSGAKDVVGWDELDQEGHMVVTGPFHGRQSLPTAPYDDLAVMVWLLYPGLDGTGRDLATMLSVLNIKLPDHGDIALGMDIGRVARTITAAYGRVFDLLMRHLRNEGLDTVYQELDRPVALLLRQMEAIGIPVIRNTADVRAEKLETQRQWAGWPSRFVTPFTRRVHPTWCQTMSVTGRVTARDPALQSLPKSLRYTVTAPPGRRMVAADYSAADFRAAAGLSRDPELLRLFNGGGDPYFEVGLLAGYAARGKERQVGKQTALAALYSSSPGSLAEDTGLPLPAVKSMVAGYKTRFPKLWQWHADQLELYRSGREIRNPWGRILLPSSNSEVINHLCQSTTADIVKTAMLRLHDTLPTDAAIILQNHDELMVECAESDSDNVATTMREAMTTPISQVPVVLAVKIGIGKSWAEATELQG